MYQIQHRIGLTHCDEEVQIRLKEFVRILSIKFAKKLLAASRNRQQFLRRNHTWLDSDATLPEELQNLIRTRQTTN